MFTTGLRHCCPESSIEIVGNATRNAYVPWADIFKQSGPVGVYDHKGANMQNSADNFGSYRIAVVIPCYRVKAHVLEVIRDIPQIVQSIYCVDDACPEASGTYIEQYCRDVRVKVIRHTVNKGVGGASLTGFDAAAQDGADIIVKLDGDGQMKASDISRMVRPIKAGHADYTKGNRFYNVEDVKQMPKVRIFGNAILSLLSKVSTGYWDIFDPTNGFIAIHARVYEQLPRSKISTRWFFESDLLFRLNTIRAVVADVPISALYADEKSNLKIRNIIVEFLMKHVENFMKRIFYNYFLRDFSVASLELLLGLVLTAFGVTWGTYKWVYAIIADSPTPTGTIMLVTLSTLLGVQFLLSFLNYDIESVPRFTLQNRI